MYQQKIMYPELYRDNGLNSAAYRLMTMNHFPYTMQLLRESTNKEEEEMSLSSKIKELSLNADDKLLREYGVVDDDGDLTCEGKRVLENLLFEENKAAIVAKLKEVKAAEKKESK